MSKQTNALGVAMIYVFVSLIVILIASAYYPMDYIYWSYLFTAVLLTLTVAWIVWYAYLHDNINLVILFWLLGITIIVLLTYFVLEYHHRNITVVIQPI